MAYPSHYRDAEGKLWRIIDRLPYVLPGEIASLTPGQTDVVVGTAETYVHNIEAPFELHRLFPRAVQLAGGAASAPIADPAPSINAFWRLRMRALQKGDFALLRAATVVDSLVDRTYGYWQISGPQGDSPVYLERGQGVQIFADSLEAAGGENFRVNVTLIGAVVSLRESPPEEIEIINSGNARSRGWSVGRNSGLP